MSCSNTVYLVCCSDPSPTFSIQPCNPIIDGVVGSFTPGTTYVSTGDTVSGDVCWSATTTLIGSLIYYEPPGFLTFPGTCNQCTLPYNPPTSYGGNCIVPTGWTNAIMAHCCDPTITLEAQVSDLLSPGTGATFVYSGNCYTINSLGGSGGPQLLPSYDGCVPCIVNYPCCECVEINIGSSIFALADGGDVFVDYGLCSGGSETVTATSITNVFNICHQSGTTITTFFDVGGSPFSTTTYPWDPLAIGPPDGEVSATTLNVCIGEPCGISPTPTPTPTATTTPTNTPTPTVTPTITPTVSSSQSITPSFFNYSVSVTGTCDSSFGSALIIATGGTAPYTFDCITPPLGTGAFKTGLSAGTYIVRANDSTMPINNEFFINVTISDGLSLVVSNVTDTTCGQNNGTATIVATSDDSDITYYLYSGGTLLLVQTSTNLTTQFVGLEYGLYDVIGVNTSNCSGSTGNFIIGESDELDFGFYIVNDTECASPTGKVYVTGLTGNAPYTYLWNNLATTSSITGLTNGSYSVTVTDSQGCVVNKSALVDFVPSVGLGSWSATTPTCFASDGSLTLTITGGTGPYLYSGSNGTTSVTYATSFVFSGLPAGSFFVNVTDAALCKVTLSTTLQTPQTIYSVQNTVTNSTCSSSNGSIDVFLQGGSAPYTYVLSSSTSSISATTNSTEYIFTNLVNGEYNLTISDGGPCPYSVNLTVDSEDLFDVTYSATTSSCGDPNGTLTLMATTGGTLPYIYTLSDGQSFTTSSLEVTFSSLLGGGYTYSITEAGGCTISGSAVVPDESVLEFSLFPTSCGISGSGGTITALITSGQPPFIYNWSANVVGNPQEIYVTGLTGGTYSLTITDDNGCVKNRSAIIECSPILTTYQIFNMCETDFEFTSGTKRGMVQMLNEGFNDLTSPQVGCILSATTFTIEIDLSGNTYTDLFYTGSTLLDVPSDSQYYQAVEDLLLTIPGVTSVTIDPITSQVTIESGDVLSSQNVLINLIIGYSILCPGICPTPTPTPTVTLTPTTTPTQTPTPSPSA